jgi:hypothetical protein
MPDRIETNISQGSLLLLQRCLICSLLSTLCDFRIQNSKKKRFACSSRVACSRCVVQCNMSINLRFDTYRSSFHAVRDSRDNLCFSSFLFIFRPRPQNKSRRHGNISSSNRHGTGGSKSVRIPLDFRSFAYNTFSRVASWRLHRSMRTARCEILQSASVRRSTSKASK